MKKFILGVSLGVLVLSAFFVYGGDTRNEGKPFTELWEAIEEIRTEIASIWAALEDIESTPGPVGPQGPQGEPGPEGTCSCPISEEQYLALLARVAVLENKDNPELCDGIDNNLDGETDEGFDVGASCSVGLGACMAEGLKICSEDGLSTECDAVPGTPSEEVCDGVDNDCDGETDEGSVCVECKRDVVMVLDESGSISSADFAAMKNFAISVVNYLNVTPENDHAGVVYYSDNARNIIALSSNNVSVFNAINDSVQAGGATCIGCGINQASVQFVSHGLRPGATRIAIVLTDGENNRPSVGAYAHLTQAISTAEGYDVTLVAVGVGGSVSETEIERIATDIPGVQTAFLVPDFNALSGVLDQMFPTCTGDYFF